MIPKAIVTRFLSGSRLGLGWTNGGRGFGVSIRRAQPSRDDFELDHYRSVLESASFSKSSSSHGQSVQSLVSHQSFPHLWKKLWKFADLGRGESLNRQNRWGFEHLRAETCEIPARLAWRKATEGGLK